MNVHLFVAVYGSWALAPVCVCGCVKPFLGSSSTDFLFLSHFKYNDVKDKIYGFLYTSSFLSQYQIGSWLLLLKPIPSITIKGQYGRGTVEMSDSFFCLAKTTLLII